MKIIFKIITVFYIFFFLSCEVLAAQIGVLEVQKTNSTKVLSIKPQNTTLIPINIYLLNTLKSSKFPAIIISEYQGLTEEHYNSIIKYIKSGGKIILATPSTTTEDTMFARLSKQIGVNVEKIKTIAEKTDINWIEKTLSGNSLKPNARIAQVTIPDASHLAVFGDIERHESAISKNPKGAVISWEFAKVGEKKFNEKSLQFLLEELLPNTISKNATTTSLFNYNDQIEDLKITREYVEKYQDNIINYSQDISLAQENLELAKIDEIFASFYHKNNNYKEYEKYAKKSKKNLLGGIFGTNNLAPAENRGIWFDRGTIVDIRSQNEMGQYFKKLKKSGINTVYFETFNAGYTIYPTKIGTQNPLTKGKDPLKWAIEEAHKRDIKIHAWMWIFAVGNDRHNKILNKKDDYVGPVLEKNMRWALLGENGNFRPKNQPEFWIDPSNKEGIAFLLSLAKEVASNYDIDGIQLDYIRYPFQRSDNLMGFNHNSAEQFANKTGEKIFVDNYQNNVLWNKWKEDNINTFVKRINIETKHIDPNLKISASVFSKSQQNRLGSIQQNWENWINNHTIDSLTPMSYSVSTEALDTNLFYLKPQAGACLIYPGIALKHVDEIALMEQISKIRAEGFPGISLFAVAQLDENKSSFMEQAIFSTDTFDPIYNPQKAGMLLLKDYLIMLETIRKTNYALTTSQKEELTKIKTTLTKVVNHINTSQLNLAIATLEDLEILTDRFFSKYSQNPEHKKTAISYLKRASNLLKIAAPN